MKINQTLYAQHIVNITRLANDNTLWSDTAKGVLARAAQDHNTDDFLQLLHEIQRLNKIQEAKIANNPRFFEACKKETLPMWKDYGSPSVDLGLQEELARKLYNIRPGKNDIGLIRLGAQARDIGRLLAEKCDKAAAPFIVEFDDASFNALVLNHASEPGIKNLAAAYVQMLAPVNRVMSAGSGLPDQAPIVADKEKGQLYSREAAPFGTRISSGEVFYTLTTIPTRKDAALDGIDYDDYLKLFFGMCDQPWEAISNAQQSLIEEFNAASLVRITNNDGTDVSMSLIDNDGSHFTFCNSLIAKNVPGSEIFSAPRLDSVEGVVVAKGRFSPGKGEIVENLRLEFEKGRLVRYSAEKGQDAFEQAIGIDDGARFVGELGIGTNPYLNMHVINGLLVEKIGGSFHLALGKPYTYTEYEGEPVKVNNGGESALHWDITTMLLGKEGRISLDGRTIMDNGKWLDPKYDALNRGWEAIPVKDRPDRWKASAKAPQLRR